MGGVNVSKLAEIKARLAMPAEMVVKLSNEHRQIIDDAKLWMDVVDVVRGLNTPRQVIAQWRRIADKTRPDDAVLAAQFDEYAEAWEGIA